MAIYNYSRELVSGQYNINNKERVDGEGNQIHIFTEIKAVLPGKPFKINCSDTSVEFNFNDSLSAEEKTTLDNTVASHKNNT